MAYNEGSGKAILVLFLILIVVVAASHWQTTLFFLRFVWDLIVINLQPLLDKIHPHTHPA